ncbi:MAG: DUF6165 family protein [Pseudomonadota bacterium]
MSVTIEISIGELLDKITILEIKAVQITDPNKQSNVQHELSVLNKAWASLNLSPDSVKKERSALKEINETLWEIEDQIRELEAEQSFGEDFIQLARSVYKTNDKRAAVKRTINEKLGSQLVEEKSYQAY